MTNKNIELLRNNLNELSELLLEMQCPMQSPFQLIGGAKKLVDKIEIEIKNAKDHNQLLNEMHNELNQLTTKQLREVSRVLLAISTGRPELIDMKMSKFKAFLKNAKPLHGWCGALHD